MHVLNLGMIACFVYAIPIRAKMSSLNAKSPSLRASIVLCSVMLGPPDSEIPWNVREELFNAC